MKNFLFVLFSGLSMSFHVQAQFNDLWIPDTLAGPDFNLTIKDTLAQIKPGQQTITAGINSKFWGPTLIFHKGDTVRMRVVNKLNEATTLHWHGMHLPAVMDGGPHQVIPPNAVWAPYWKVKNHAATYWYHPHLHEKTMEHITKGIGGFIIVRDSAEAALTLPRTYGVDDIPLVLSDRDINSSNQFDMVPYGDSMMTNGVLRARHTVPAQVIRFRILNAAIERSFNIGFSDNRSFYVIASDGGLLAAPVAKTKYLLHAGERIEILVNFSGQSGQAFQLKAYNSQLAQNVAGGDLLPGNGPFTNYLARKDFNMLQIVVGPQNSSAVTSVPATLVNVETINPGTANITRKLTISDSTGVTNPVILGPNAFIINHKLFNINYNQYQVPLGNTEIWEITSTSGFGHPFHIHDVEFNVLSVNGAAPDPTLAGWKDVVFIPAKTGGGPGPGGTPSVIRFIAKFDDYADSEHPFMYHCHISLHEDEGMMGQFVVTPAITSLNPVNSTADFTLYPNPADNRLYLNFSRADASVYYLRIANALGKVQCLMPRPELQDGIDISKLSRGIYFVEITDALTKEKTIKQVLKN